MGPSQLDILLAQVQLLHACIMFSAFMLPHAWQRGRPARFGAAAEQARQLIQHLILRQGFPGDVMHACSDSDMLIVKVPSLMGSMPSVPLRVCGML